MRTELKADHYSATKNIRQVRSIFFFTSGSIYLHWVQLKIVIKMEDLLKSCQGLSVRISVPPTKKRHEDSSETEMTEQKSQRLLVDKWFKHAHGVSPQFFFI